MIRKFFLKLQLKLYGLLKCILCLLAVLTVIWILIFIGLQTSLVRNWAQQKILELAHAQTGLQFQIEKVDFSFPFSVHLSNVKISKNEQIAALVNEIEISLFSPALLNQKLIFPYIKIDGLYLGSLELPDAESSSLPIEIQHLDINEIHLGSHFVDNLNLPSHYSALLKQSTLRLKGNLHSPALQAHFILTATDYINATPPLHISLDLLHNKLTLSARFSRFPLQILVESPTLSPHTSCDLFYHAETTFPFNDQLEGRFKITLRSPHAEDLIDSLISEKSTIDGIYSWKEPKEFHITNLSIKSKQCHITGEATLGKMHYKVALKGQCDLIPDIDDLQAYFSGSFEDNDFKGKMHLSGNFQTLPFTAQTDYQINSTSLKLSSLEWLGLGSRLTGDLSLFSPDWNPVGSLEGHIPDLAPFGKLLDETIKGQAELNIALLASKEIRGNIIGKNLEWRDAKAEKMTFSTEMTQNPYQFQIDAQDLSLHDFSLSQVALQASLDASTQKWIFACQIHRNNLALNSNGFIAHEKHDWNLHLDALNGNLGSYPLQLQTPFSIQYQPPGFSFPYFQLRLGEGWLEGKAENKQNDIQLQIRGEKIASAAIEELLPEIPFEGILSFTSIIQGTLSNPEGQIELNLQDIRLKEPLFSHLPAIQGAGNLSWKNGMSAFKIDIQGIGRNPISLNGDLPLNISLSPFSAALGNNSMNMELEAEGEIGPFLHLFNQDTNLITGDAKAKLRLSGTLEKPEIKGSFDLINGSYESFSMGSIYHNINAHLEGEGSRIFIRQFSATNENSGKLTATGFLDLIKNQDYPFEIQITPSNIALLDSDYAKISGSGALQLKGSLKGGKLSGSLNLEQGLISIEEEKPAQIKSVDVTYINLPDDKKTAESAAFHWPLELAIQAHIPDLLKINGDHFTSVWKGDLAITGTPEYPLVNGDLRVSRGEFNLNGKIFEISLGTIHFGGSLEKKTFLHIVASKEIDPIKVDIVLQGSTQNPALSFRSTPPLSEREVLSYILFNRGISDITTSQGNQLNQSFLTLSSSSNDNNDFLSKIRNNIGLDRLDLSSGGAETNEFSLQMGKYISKGVLIGLNKGINSAANRVTIEAELHKNIKAQAELGDDGTGKIQIKWKKSY